MPKLRRENTETSAPASAPNLKPNPVKLVAAVLREWTHNGRRILPEPMPRDPEEAAVWWIEHMQEPEKPGETRLAVTSDGRERWDTGYANRCSQSAIAWMRMTYPLRMAVVKGVREDKVPYRGDTFEFYQTVWDEHLHMREVGVEQYRKESLARFIDAVVKLA